MEEQKIELKIINMADIQAQEIEWLWYPFIPYGKLTIIQGDPGDGKTTLVLNLAAKLSKGIGLDEDMPISEPMNIIYQTAEDGLADTVKPRLEAADADCEKIMVIDESEKSLSMVDERLEQAIIQTNARLLILDPIQAYLGGGVDMNRANEARDMTKKLGLLAEKYKCAIILIGHMNKAAGNKAALAAAVLVSMSIWQIFLMPRDRASNPKAPVPAKKPAGRRSYIIVASLTSDADAQAALKKYRKSGYKDAEVVESKGRYRIALCGYSDQAAAYRKVTELRKDDRFKSAWVFTVSK